MEVFVVGWALVTLDVIVVARLGYGRLRGARRRAFLQRRLGIVETADRQPASAPRPAVAAALTSSPTFV